MRSCTGWRRITVASIQAGQPRPYTDSVYEAEICFEGGTRSTIPGYDLPFGTQPPEAQVRQVVRLLVHDFAEDGDPDATWASGRLRELSMIAQGPGYSVWRAKVVCPYTD